MNFIYGPSIFGMHYKNESVVSFRENLLTIVCITLVTTRCFPHFLLVEKEEGAGGELVVLRWCFPSWGNSS